MAELLNEFNDPELQSFIASIGAQLKRSENPQGFILPPGFSVSAVSSSLLSLADLNTGSLQYYSEKFGKIFFLKANEQENTQTELLREGGFEQVIRYGGRLQIDRATYFYGRMPGDAVNLSYYVLCDEKPEPRHFNTFDILRTAATLIARIHKMGYTHQRFLVNSLIVTPSYPTPLVLYHNSGLRRSASNQDRQKDLQSFISSLTATNPQCNHQKHDEFFLDAYNQFIKQ